MWSHPPSKNAQVRRRAISLPPSTFPTQGAGAFACLLSGGQQKVPTCTEQAASAHQQAWHRLARNNVNPRNRKGKKMGAETQELEGYCGSAPEHMRHTAQARGRKRRNRNVSSSSGTCDSLGGDPKGKSSEGIIHVMFLDVVGSGRR